MVWLNYKGKLLAQVKLKIKKYFQEKGIKKNHEL